MSKTRQKVVVGMSGGVDSSVSAALLVRQGYEVIGAFMKNWSQPEADPPGAEDCKSRGECSWRQERRDAMSVAAKLNIPFVTFDFEREYKENVVGYLFREYEAGRTPNPDVMCNSFIKFPLFWAEAKKLGADFIATGHYARTDKGKLLLSEDPDKDQTYFLQRVNKGDLEHTLFPVGHLKKPAVRELAREMQIPTAEKKDSTGICFIGEVPMEEFLSQRIPKKKGDIVTSEGKVVGTHNGVWFYTIGQRHGFGGVSAPPSTRAQAEGSLSQGGGGMPYFVVDRNLERNELIVAPGADNPRLYKKEIEISDMHWISGSAPKLPLACKARIRHRGELFNVTLKMLNASCYVLHAEEAQRAATPGQMAAIYAGGECLGGGIIV